MTRLSDISTDVLWFRHSRLPVSVRLNYIAPNGQHPLTPSEIRKRYVEEVADSSLVIWQYPQTQTFGLRAGIDELAWPLHEIGGFELWFCRPAKGAGEVSIWVRRSHLDLVLSSDRFTPELLDWFRPITATLTKVFPSAVTEKDCGSDS